MPGPRSKTPVVPAGPSLTAEWHDTVFSNYCAFPLPSSHLGLQGLPPRSGPFNVLGRPLRSGPAETTHTTHSGPQAAQPWKPDPHPRPQARRFVGARPGEAPSSGGLTCRRWLLTRCMLSAGLLGRILPQPRTVHRMLVRTARDSSLTDGWISSPAGTPGVRPPGCCLAAPGRGRLPLSRPGGPHRPEAAAAPFAAAGPAGVPEARAPGPAAAASEAAIAPALQPGRAQAPPSATTSGRGRGLPAH